LHFSHKIFQEKKLESKKVSVGGWINPAVERYGSKKKYFCGWANNTIYGCHKGLFFIPNKIAGLLEAYSSTQNIIIYERAAVSRGQHCGRICLDGSTMASFV
jgi:hypothetical protein